MIILDTNALIFDALTPERLTLAAQRAISEGERKKALACSCISLWEIAMLIDKKRIRPEMEATSFIRGMLVARALKVLPINPEIAVMAQSAHFAHGDPADRLIAATALHHHAELVTADQRLREIADLSTIW